MSELHKLQQSLQNYLLRKDSDIKQFIIDPVHGNRNERLEIYGDAYRLRLLEVLSKEYSVLNRYLGEEKFTQLGNAYIDAYPSKYFSVDDFCQHMAKFLATDKTYADQPHLSELANLTWQLGNTLIATNALVLTAEQVQKIDQHDWPQLCFKIQPSLCLMTFHWNTFAIWQAVEKRQKPPKAVLEKTSVNCVVWRKQMQPYYLLLEKDAAWMLKALEHGHSFAQVCEGLSEWHAEDQVASKAVSYLLQWINEQIFSEIYLAK